MGRKRKNETKTINTSAKRVGNYIFIESALQGAELCVRCALYPLGEKRCLPCRDFERKDKKQGYWRLSKQSS